MMHTGKYRGLGEIMGKRGPRHIEYKNRDSMADNGSRAHLQVMEELRMPES